MPQIGILTIGNEVTDGRIINTNASYIAQELRNDGFEPVLHSSCQDDVGQICDCLRHLEKHCRGVIISGGLGPTSDDKTREAISAFTGKELELNEGDLNRLKSFYRSRGREFEPANRVQAFFPSGSQVIENPTGTASGIFLSLDTGFTLIALPGVPNELKRMLPAHGVPLLQRTFSVVQPPKAHTLRFFGTPESTVGRWVSQLNLPEGISVGYRAQFPELEVRLTHEQDTDALSQAQTKVIEAIGEDYLVTALPNQRLPQFTAELLMQQKKTISVAESCTGGLLGKLLTEEPGASAFFLGGGLTYANNIKEKLLGVSPDTLAQHGAVSEETAMEMARGARDFFETDLALSITGIAGPDGGSEEKPVGTFYIGLAHRDQVRAFHHFFSSHRAAIRTFAAYMALDTVRRFLLGLPFFSPLRA